MNLLSVHPTLRWTAPLGAAVLVVGGSLASTHIASASADSASTTLPHRTVAQLVTGAQQSHVEGLSGTLVESADLGLPDLPSRGGGGDAQLSSLVSGSHTLRVWTAGTDRSRIAVLGTFGESDVIRNGNNVWVWSSSDKSATHLTLPADSPRSAPTSTATTPADLASRLLAQVGPTTAVTQGAPVSVAGRSAYQLVVTPRQSGTLVRDIRIAIDAKTQLPLRVRVYSTQLSKPAFELGFTSLSLGRPDASRFAFNPPPGTKVTTMAVPTDTQATMLPQQLSALVKRASPKVVGTGWTSVLTATLPGKQVNGITPKGASGSDQTPSAAGSSRHGDGSSMQQLLGLLPQVHGAWGSGHLLRGTLFSALVTDDGRLLVGSVTPGTLYSAAAR